MLPRLYIYLLNNAGISKSLDEIWPEIEIIDKMVEVVESTMKESTGYALYTILGSLLYIKYLVNRQQGWQQVDFYEDLIEKAKHSDAPEKKNRLEDLYLEFEKAKRAAIQKTYDFSFLNISHTDTLPDSEIENKYNEWKQNRDKLLRISASNLIMAYETLAKAADMGSPEAKVMLFSLEPYGSSLYRSLLKDYATRVDQYMALFKEGFFFVDSFAGPTTLAKELIFTDNGRVEDGALGNKRERVKKSVESVQYCEKAAEMGNAEAQYLMGVILSFGVFAEQDIRVAVHWLKKATEQENSDAMNLLGCIYLSGQGISKDKNKARELFETAIRLGNKPAERNLRIYFEKNIELDVLSFDRCDITINFSENSFYFRNFDRLIEAAMAGNGDAALLLSKGMHWGNNYCGVFWLYVAAKNGAALNREQKAKFAWTGLYKNIHPNSEYSIDICLHGQKLMNIAEVETKYAFEEHVDHFSELYRKIKRNIDMNYYTTYLLSFRNDGKHEEI